MIIGPVGPIGFIAIIGSQGSWGHMEQRGHGLLDGGEREDHRFSDADSAGYREPPDLLALADGATGYVEAAILRLRDMSPR